MKILHTADIHLREVGNRQWKTLELILQIAEREHVDAVVIAGDFFDSGYKGDVLRGPLRTLFSTYQMPVIIIPGNHDEKTFQTSKIFLGDKVSVIENLLNPVDLGAVMIWGLPYRSMGSTEVLHELQQVKDNLTQDKTHILLHHGDFADSKNLSTVYRDQTRGKKYMPIKSAFFQELDFKYVLSGHIHSRFDITLMRPGQFFVYPGSPSPMDYTETGPRAVNIFEVGKAPVEYPLDVAYFLPKIIDIDPLNPTPPMDIIKSNLNTLPNNAVFVLTITGYINNAVHHTDETQLKQDLDNFLKTQNIHFCPPRESDPVSYYDVQDITPILESPIYLRFIAKLTAQNHGAQESMLIRTELVRAMQKTIKKAKK
jgi:DNA repair exonuclease SbcCD nuclease subunit